MKILVTGSAGHLGEALMRSLVDRSHDAVGLDRVRSPFTTHVGSITDRTFVKDCVSGVQAIIHTATLHKPHLATHSRQAFIDTNITGTLNLLEEAADHRIEAFVFTSTTSVFGDALRPSPGVPAAWITEDIRPVPKNIYGVSKGGAEDLCELFHKRNGLACLVLRTSRFFPEDDDDRSTRQCYGDDNAKANELLFRRVDIEDAVDAHLLAVKRAATIGFGRYIVSATTPFLPEDLEELRTRAPDVVRKRIPTYETAYRQRGWRMFPSIDRVYVNTRARHDLGWRPRYDFASVIGRLNTGLDLRSPLALAVGSKGYHDRQFTDGPYPVE